MSANRQIRPTEMAIRAWWKGVGVIDVLDPCSHPKLYVLYSTPAFVAYQDQQPHAVVVHVRCLEHWQDEEEAVLKVLVREQVARLEQPLGET
jgi:hypothetical protein